jgi:hypothetical protein
LFSRNENGTPRNWRLVDEEEIERIFLWAKEEINKLLMMFRFFRLLKVKDNSKQIKKRKVKNENNLIDIIYEFI